MEFLILGRIGSRAASIMLLIAFVMVVRPATLAAAPGKKISEEQLSELHAALVLKIAMFVQWPEEAPELSEYKISLAVSGDDRVFQAFKKLEKKTIKGQTIALNHTALSTDLSTSRIVFFSSDQPYEIVPWPGVLTIGDSSDFNARGGMIRLSIENGRPRFSINLKSAEAAGIEFSSKLLKIASIYKGDIQ